jgi:putative transcriptional regulator
MRTKHIVKARLGIDGRLKAIGSGGRAGRALRPRFVAERADAPAAYAADRDTPKLTRRQLAAMKPARVVERVDVAAIRRKLNLSQGVFAAFFGIALPTLRDWEQGRRRPDATARAYLRVIARAPETVRRALDAD